MAKSFTMIKLDRERKLRLSNIAIFTFEEMTGKSIFDLSEMNANGESQLRFSVRDLNYILYAGLECMDKTITFDEVKELVDEHCDINYLNDVLLKAITKSSFFNQASDEKKVEMEKD